MKKLLSIIVVVLCFVSCSSDDDSDKPLSFTQSEKVLLETFTGTFLGEYYSLGVLYDKEEITFTPYTAPKEVVSLFGTFNVAGTATIETNSTITPLKNYYFVFSKTKGGTNTLSFYQYDISSGEVVNNQDERVYTIISKNAFKMRNYGLSEENDVEFTRK